MLEMNNMDDVIRLLMFSGIAGQNASMMTIFVLGYIAYYVYKEYIKRTSSYMPSIELTCDIRIGSAYSTIASKEYMAVSHYLESHDLCKNKFLYNDDDPFAPKAHSIAVCKENDLTRTEFADIEVISTYTRTSTEKSDFTYIVVSMIVSSKKTLRELNRFLDICMKEYKKHLKNKEIPGILKFMYSENGIVRSYNLLRHGRKNVNETFDSIFHKHKIRIMKDIDKLADEKYYDSHGLKRKLGYLFYGLPGSGKTATISAISNYTKRHIKQASLNNFLTIDDLLTFLFVSAYQGKQIEMSEMIFVIDEINIDSLLVEPAKNFSTKKQKLNLLKNHIDDFGKNETPDAVDEKVKKLRIEDVLSALDGIFNYDGAIIIATCNDISKFPPALFRDGRLDLIEFGYMLRDDVYSMLKYHYCDVDGVSIDRLVMPDVVRQDISASTLMRMIRQNEIETVLKWIGE